MSDIQDNCVTIYIKEAKELPPKEFNGLTDLFCEVYVRNKRKGKTSVQKNTPTTKWDSPCEFSFEFSEVEDLVRDSTEILIKVFDEESDLFGVVWVPIDGGGLNQAYREQWYTIGKSEAGEGRCQGKGTLLVGVQVTSDRKFRVRNEGLPDSFVDKKHDLEIINRLKQKIDPVSLFLAMPRVVIIMKRKAQMARDAVEVRHSSSDPIFSCSAGSLTKKHESSEKKQLLDRLHMLGLKLVESEGDGNCQFRSFSYQLYGTQEHYKHVRKLIAGWMREHPNSFNFYFGNEKEFETYLVKMERDRTWGDEMTLKAASDLFATRVHVISSTLENWYLTYTPDSEPDENNKQMFLAYVSPVHYNSVILDTTVNR
eukprot:CFRG2431T1